MMDFIAIPVTCGICVYGLYKIIEVMVRKRERILFIEKISEIQSVNLKDMNIDNVLGTQNASGNMFAYMRWGFLLCGIGLGLLVGYLIASTDIRLMDNNYWVNQYIGTVYGASTLLFGGLGLLAGTLVEIWAKKKMK